MSSKKPYRSLFVGMVSGFLMISAVYVFLSVLPDGLDRSLAQDKKKDLIITPLYDNTSSRKDLKSGWGFSCLIQGTPKTLFFDVADQDVLKNMAILNIDPALVDVVVISHDHYDHIGGLSAFSARNSRVVIYISPQNALNICENVHTTGAMDTHPAESDSFIKGTTENSLIIGTARGLVIVTGCAHPGIVEIVQKAKSMFPGETVYLVMGGFHLHNSSRGDILKIIKELKKENVKKVAPCHCTGDMAESAFQDLFGSDYITCDIGKPLLIEGAFAGR